MRVHLLLPAALLTLALSACGGGTPDPGPTSAAPDPAPTETADPGPDPATVAARIDVSTTAIVITAADDSTLADLSIYDASTTVIDTLTDALGAAPTESDEAGGLETAPSRVYDWSGFAIIDYEGETIMNTDFVVDIGTAAIGDVGIYATGGLQFGDPMADAIALGEGTSFPEYVSVGAVPIDPATVGEDPSWELAIQTGVSGSGGTISRIVAPTPNWGV